MYEDKPKTNKILGVITARGGSKGIPGKNIKLLGGKPLIAYTIEAAKASGVFDRVVLSTDDEAIVEVARAYGCDVPFMRPSELAQDNTPHLPVLQHVVGWLRENEGYDPDYVMILQPTTPFRQSFHIREAVETVVKEDADSVLAVSELPDNLSIRNIMLLAEDGGLRLVNGAPVRTRAAQRQLNARHYYNTTAIYLFKTHLLFDSQEPNFFGEKVVPYVIDAKYAVDINEPEDWERAEETLQRLQALDK